MASLKKYSGDGTARVRAVGLPGRYALALFGLAMDRDQLALVSESLRKICTGLADCPEFALFLSNPLVQKKQFVVAMKGLADRLDLDGLTRDFLCVLGHAGRLHVLADIMRVFDDLCLEQRGEVKAEAVSAQPLSDEQLEHLTKRLAHQLGGTVSVSTRINPDLIGGVTVRIGSRMIDASIQTKLDNLALAMKG